MVGLYNPESGLLGSSRRIFINVERPGIFLNHAGIHGHLAHIVQLGELEHGLQKRLFEDRAKAARTRFAIHCPLGYGP